MKELIEDTFPLSKKRTVKGSRRLAREKVVQVLYAYELSGEPWTIHFEYLFSRKFNFGDDVHDVVANITTETGKIMSMTQVYESDADIPIEWDKINIDYATTVLEKTIENKPMYNDIIRSKVKNWNIDRIAVIDRIAFYIAATEMIYIEGTPMRVSINEAVEIGRKYSTEDSGRFINGVLEPLIAVLKEKNLLSQEKIDEFNLPFDNSFKKKKHSHKKDAEETNPATDQENDEKAE